MLAISNDLRQAVLQAAIQGKLTKQLPEDGNAADLLRSIQEEKQKLIAEKKIKKEKPLSPIADDDIPFEIPDNWVWERLGTVVSVYGGKRIPAGRKLSETPTTHKYIRVSDMKNGTVELDDIKYVPDDIYPLIQKYTISSNDVYITVAGTIGRVGLIPDELDGANLTENADKLVIFSDIDKVWLKLCLESYYVQRQIIDSTTQVGQPKLAIQRIQDLILPIPPSAEQHRIVQRIDELMAQIDELEKVEQELLALKKAFPGDMKAALLQSAMQGKLTEQLPEDGNAADLLRLIQEEKQKLIAEKKIKKEKPLSPIADEDVPFDIPENWQWVRLGECITLISGQDLTPAQYNSSGVGTIYLTGASNIENGNIIINRWTEFARAIAVKGDLLLTCKGTVGTTCLLQENEVHIARQIMALRPIAVNVNYIHLFIMYYVDKLKSQAKSMIPGIERANVLSAMFPLPPLAEQQRIVEKLDQLLPLCDGLSEK